MAYRRKHTTSSTSRASILSDDISSPISPTPADDSPSSLAAQAIRASSAHRDSSLSTAYGESAFLESSNRQRFSQSPQDSVPYEYTSMKTLNESKHGFWGGLARKAKSIIEDDNVAPQSETRTRTRPHLLETSRGDQFHQTYQSPETHQKMESPKLQKGLEAITSSLNYIGGTIGNALEEGLTIVENKTADIISNHKLHIRRKGSNSDTQNQATKSTNLWQPPQKQTDQETQLKASRDVAMAMAAKAKLLLRELKTVKADLAFAKERCAQLEEENKILRESYEKGDSPEDDDLIRLQLETLLAEKARLAHENSIYARENRFLREVVEYHQLKMQDVVYLDEGIEEVTEVCPIPMTPVVDALPIPTPPPGSDVSSIRTPKGPILTLFPALTSPTLSPTGSIRISRGMEVFSPVVATPASAIPVQAGEDLKQHHSPIPSA